MVEANGKNFFQTPHFISLQELEEVELEWGLKTTWNSIKGKSGRAWIFSSVLELSSCSMFQD